ncbi:unnamed protein product, partial [Meganyctiphanes norvegica]
SPQARRRYLSTLKVVSHLFSSVFSLARTWRHNRHHSSSYTSTYTNYLSLFPDSQMPYTTSDDDEFDIISQDIDEFQDDLDLEIIRCDRDIEFTKGEREEILRLKRKKKMRKNREASMRPKIGKPRKRCYDINTSVGVYVSDEIYV